MKKNMENSQKMEILICNINGVILNEDHSLSAALNFIKQLNPAQDHVLFLTDNFHLSSDEIREKLLNLGVDFDKSDSGLPPRTSLDPEFRLSNLMKRRERGPGQGFYRR